jgi:hypothetical protein
MEDFFSMADTGVIEVSRQKCVGGCTRFISAGLDSCFSIRARTKHRIVSSAGNDIGIDVLDDPGKCPSGWDSLNHVVTYRFVGQGSKVRAYVV